MLRLKDETVSAFSLEVGDAPKSVALPVAFDSICKHNLIAIGTQVDPTKHLGRSLIFTCVDAEQLHSTDLGTRNAVTAIERTESSRSRLLDDHDSDPDGTYVPNRKRLRL